MNIVELMRLYLVNGDMGAFTALGASLGLNIGMYTPRRRPELWQREVQAAALRASRADA